MISDECSENFGSNYSISSQFQVFQQISTDSAAIPLIVMPTRKLYESAADVLFPISKMGVAEVLMCEQPFDGTGTRLIEIVLLGFS